MYHQSLITNYSWLVNVILFVKLTAVSHLLTLTEWKNIIKALLLNLSQYLLKSVRLCDRRMWGVGPCDTFLWKLPLISKIAPSIYVNWLNLWDCVLDKAIFHSFHRNGNSPRKNIWGAQMKLCPQMQQSIKWSGFLCIWRWQINLVVLSPGTILSQGWTWVLNALVFTQDIL